jgi:hypothetical protein
MKQVKFLFIPVSVALFFVILNSCSRSSATISASFGSGGITYQWEQVLPFGNGSFPEQWKPGTFPLGITPIKAFNGTLWMIGQKAAWWSADGTNWTRLPKNDWGERIYTAFIYFQDKAWMFGGMQYKEKQFVNDVWFSADGSTWERAGTAQWQPRGGHTMIFFKNKLWLFGGANGVLPDGTLNTFLNDVWSSEDGIHWTEETAAAPWTARDYPKILVFRDTLYMLGGQGHADVWRSANGTSWKQLIAEAEWQKRYDYGALVFDNRMWVFGGRDTSANHNAAAKNAVWFSDNGVIWNKQTEHAPWTVRSGATSIVFKNRLWIFSGKHTGGKYNWGGDIWTMRVGQ